MLPEAAIMRTCPKCLLVNTDSAQRCDCGFPISQISAQVMEAELASAHRDALSRAVMGLVIGVGAIVVSVATLVLAGPGDQGVLFYGAIIAGLAMAGRGYSRMLDARQALAEARAAEKKRSSQEP